MPVLLLLAACIAVPPDGNTTGNTDTDVPDTDAADTADTADTSDTSTTVDDTADTGDTAGADDTGSTVDTGGDSGDTGALDTLCSRWLPWDLVGATWDYYDDEGLTYTYTAMGATTWLGQDVYAIAITSSDGTAYGYVQCDAEGVHDFGYDATSIIAGLAWSYDPAPLLVPADPTPGDHWRASTTVTIDPEGAATPYRLDTSGSVGSSAVVDVAAGSFATYAVTVTNFGPSSTSTSYVADGVGEVMTTGGRELIRYSIP
jgi:hypothetical protein